METKSAIDLPPVALFKKRTNKSNLRKRPATPPPASSSSSDNDLSDDGQDGHRIKRPRKAGVAAGNTRSSANTLNPSATTQYVADRSATIAVSQDATRRSDWYDETAPDALSAKQLLGTSTSSHKSRTADSTTTTSTTTAAAAGPGTYKGQAAYSSFITTNPDTKRALGPVKAAASNVRTITITDYAPDVCKDYKQTGFCGFGDSCKFLHAREDYAQGWKLDREWEVSNKGKKGGGGGGTVVAAVGARGAAAAAAAAKVNELDVDREAEEAAALEKIPFACIICKQSYKFPIVTKCGHYFCEKCAITRYKKSPTCLACGAGTNGVFNVARNLTKLLDKKRKREEEMAAAAAEKQDDDS